MLRREQKRGAAAAIVLVVLILLAVAGGAVYWFMAKKGAFGGSAFDMAAQLPKSARGAWMLNLRGQIDPSEIKSDWDDIVAKLPAEEKAKMEEDIKKELGVSLNELVGFFDGRAASAIVHDKDKPGFVVVVGLRDSAGFEKLVKTKVPEGGKAEAIGGVNFTVAPGGECYGQDATWAYFADSKPSAEMLVASVAGKETLAAVPAFAEAKGKVAGNGSLMAFYVDIAGSLTALKQVPPPGTDAQTFTDFACLQYAVGSMDLKDRQFNVFLKVNDDKSTLSQKLLAKGSITPASFGGLTKASSFGQALDLEWTFNSILQMAMAFPDARQGASMAGVGIAFYGNPWGAFEGDLAGASDVVELMGEVFSSNFAASRAQGQLTACKANLKNIGTALEMWSTDNSGAYPKTLAPLAPNYLKAVPECPAAGSDTYSSTYKVTGPPELFEVACSGNHHQQAKDNLPSYSGMTGLNEGQPIPGSETGDPDPSVVLTATVKDLKLAHALLAKLLPDAGAEPKAGEEKLYNLPIPQSVLKISASTPQRLIYGMGPKSAELLDTKAGTMADHASLKEALAWGGDGVVYADYLDLAPLLAGLEKAVPANQSQETEFAKVLLGKAKEWNLVGASCLTVRADGLHWRAYGSSGGMLTLGAAGGAILVPNFIRAQGQGQLTACKSNLKNIGTGLEMWATDNSGKYPTDLNQLTPNYLKTIPTCPAAGSMSYVAKFGPKAPENKEKYEDYYYVECAGGHHSEAGVDGNYPAYTSTMGILEQAP